MAFPLSERSMLCIDWDDRSLRIVAASFSRAGVRIRSAVHVPFDSGVNVRSPESLGDFLRRALAEHRIRARRVIVNVPRQDAMMNRFSLPMGSRDDLAAMVHMQLAKELPFSKDEAVIDFVIAAQEENAKMADLWVAAVRTKVIEHYRQVANAAGLKLERIGLRPYSNMVALDTEVTVTGHTLMVDVGPSMTEINVIRQGELVYSRAASVSVPVEGLRHVDVSSLTPTERPPGDRTIPLADDAIRPPTSAESLLIEVSRTIQAYRATDPSATIDRIILAGSIKIDRRVVEALEERIGSPAMRYQPLTSLKWRSVDKEGAAPFSAVLGLAVDTTTDEMLRFDFLHPKEPEAQHRQRVKRRPLAVVVVALFVAAGSVAAYQPIWQRKAEVAQLKATINTEKQGEEARKQVLKQLEELEAYRKGNVIWLDYLKLLTNVFPSNMKCYISELTLKSEGDLEMEVTAINATVATEIVEAIRSIEDKNGRRVFDALPGRKSTESKDPKYPVTDQVLVEIVSLVNAKSKKKK